MIHGHWISISHRASLSKDTPQALLFRKVFEISEGDRLQLNISADTRYRLWLNGVHICAGPCKSDSARHYYESLDLTGHLHPGKNVLAVKVVGFPVAGTHAPAPLCLLPKGWGPCLWAEGFVTDRKNLPKQDLSTGHSPWKVFPDNSTSWSVGTGTQWLGAIMEEIHGSELPHNWQAESFDDSHWERAQICLSNEDQGFGLVPVYRLTPRPIPLLTYLKGKFVRETGADAAGIKASYHVPPYSTMVLELDAGALKTAYFSWNLHGGAGSRVVVTYAEAYCQEDSQGNKVKHRRDDWRSGHLEGVQDVFFPSGSGDRFETFWFRTFRFVRLEITTQDEALNFAPPVYYQTGYPLEIGTCLHSSVPWVGQVWEVSVNTLLRCMHETYEDSPYYEQLQYVLDTRLEALFTYCLSPDSRLAKKAIQEIHASFLPEGILQSRYPCSQVQIIPLFSLYWIMMLEDYYWQTGDSAFVRSLLPTADHILTWFEGKIQVPGLVGDPGYWQFVDWAKEWDPQYGVPDALSHGFSADINLIYAAGLQCASRLHGAASHSGIAALYARQAARILEQVEKSCWNEGRQLYQEGSGLEQYSQHTQVWAVLTGLAQGHRAEHILLEALQDSSLVQCTFPMMFFLFRALEKENLYGQSQKLWALWVRQLENGLTTWPEVPDCHARSDCHAWSALPLYEFTRCFLGVRPGAPGYESIDVRPAALYLPELDGTAATPKGQVQVRWQQRGGQFSIQAVFPPGVPGKVILPDGTAIEAPAGGTVSGTLKLS